jgi:CRP-like cAMP-binding protein
MRIGKYEFQPPVDTETGEEVSLEELIEYFLQQNRRENGWEMGYPQELAGMLMLIPSAGAQVLAYILTTKRRDNKLEQTNQQIADDLGMSLKSVAKTMKEFEKHGYIRRGTRGIRMISPRVLSWGSGTFHNNKRKWEELG